MTMICEVFDDIVGIFISKAKYFYSLSSRDSSDRHRPTLNNILAKYINVLKFNFEHCAAVLIIDYYKMCQPNEVRDMENGAFGFLFKVY